jgi:hypothetical protein
MLENINVAGSKTLESHEVLNPITPDEFSTLFDESGGLVNRESFKRRLYYAGVSDPSLIPKIVPFAVEIWPIGTTESERSPIDAE